MPTRRHYAIVAAAPSESDLDLILDWIGDNDLLDHVLISGVSLRDFTTVVMTRSDRGDEQSVRFLNWIQARGRDFQEVDF